MTPRIRPTIVVWLAGLGLLCLAPALSTAQRLSAPLSVTATSAGALRAASDIVTQMEQAGDLRSVRRTVDPLVPGRTHERFQQFWRGLPVLEATVTRQQDGAAARSVFGSIHPEVQVDTTPRLSAAQAQRLAFGEPSPPAAAEPRLAIFLDSELGYRLVYETRRFDAEGLRDVLVDAHSGQIVRSLNVTSLQTAILPCRDCVVGSGRGVKGDRKKVSATIEAGVFTARDALRPVPIRTYDMRGDWRRTLDVLIGDDFLIDADLAADGDNDWNDGANVDAHTGTGWFSDYLYHRFERSGLDDRRSPIVSLVHPVNRSDLLTVPSEISNLFHLNAFFCGLCGPFGTLVYGEGMPSGFVLTTGQSVDFFSAGLDIVGHELAHAVTESSSQLINQGESGALSEAFSDLLGAGTEFFVADTGRHRVEQADYVIGEDVLKPGGIRSLSDPQSLGDPDHFSKRFTGTADNGGVHTNSTIVSHAYYLAVEGGTNRTSGLRVEGVGSANRHLVERAFYRAYVFMLPSDATFAVARMATIQSARDLAGEGSALEQTIRAAWDAVGVE